MPILLTGTAVCFVLLVAVYKTNKTRYLGGFFLLCTLVGAGLSYALWAMASGQRWLQYTVLVPVGLLGLLLAFGVYVLAGLLLLNARAVRRRERRSLGNSLTLLLAFGILVLVAGGFVLQKFTVPQWAHAVYNGCLAVVFFYFFVLATFLATLLLANLARPAKKQDYIIVLGSGLVGGEVPPLLAARIRRAMRFCEKQAKRRAPPKLVMSGGQGADEPVAEAAAMREWAVREGMDPAHILVEDSSTTTQENMRFSKQVMEFAEAGRPYRCIYATSNYHVLRAGALARKEGLRIDGLGARTAPYYLPNAILREFAAMLWLNKKRNLLLAGLVFSLVAGFRMLVPPVLDALARYGA